MTAREQVVTEAMRWLGTPYHHQADVMGGGVDCAMILIRVYHAVGLIPDIDPRPYPADWMLHREEERYLGFVTQYARPTENPRPGDIALFKFGRCLAHGAIVLGDKQILHAYRPAKKVVIQDLDQTPDLTRRLAGFFTLFED